MTVFDILCQNNIDEQKAKDFETYYNLLVDWNEKINLTAITEP